jgi:hypothetical protein
VKTVGSVPSHDTGPGATLGPEPVRYGRQTTLAGGSKMLRRKKPHNRCAPRAPPALPRRTLLGRRATRLKALPRHETAQRRLNRRPLRAARDVLRDEVLVAVLRTRISAWAVLGGKRRFGLENAAPERTPFGAQRPQIVPGDAAKQFRAESRIGPLRKIRVT